MTPRAVLAWSWTLVILGLCWLPRDFLPEKERLPWLFFLPSFDKMVHLGLFAVFGFLWMRVGPSAHKGRWVLLAGLALATISELGQMSSIVNRDADLGDGLYDMIGVVSGIVAYRIARKPFERRAAQPGV
jgi:hypothetical protein